MDKESINGVIHFRKGVRPLALSLIQCIPLLKELLSGSCGKIENPEMSTSSIN